MPKSRSSSTRSPLAENSFWHHAGHGIGHHGHEAPRIIPGSDDVFEVGDVITLEPGIYTEALHGGIRLEDNYVVRAAWPGKSVRLSKGFVSARNLQGKTAVVTGAARGIGQAVAIELAESRR